MDRSAVDEYLNAGKKLMPMGVKTSKPIVSGWLVTEFDKEDIYNAKNAGWVLGDTDLVIDVDPRNGGFDSWEKLEADLALGLSPTVFTPRDGFHIYLTVPGESRQLLTKLKDYPGIDFKRQGGFVATVGSYNESVGKGYEWADEFLTFYQLECPGNLLNLLKTYHRSDEEDLGDFEGLIFENSMSREEIERLVDKLNPSMSQDDWVQVGMALHSWNSLEGLEIWEEWSKKGDNYTEGDTEHRWKYFKHGPTTVGTLVYKAKEADFEESYERFNNLISEIQNSDLKTLKLSVIKRLTKADLDELDREHLAKCLQDRIKELTGSKPAIVEVRKMIKPSKDLVKVERQEVPGWLKHWVYVNASRHYVNVNNFAAYNSEAFNLANGVNVPVGEFGKTSAIKYAADNGFIEVVDHEEYLPLVTDRLCTINGKRVLNSFRQESLPTVPDRYTKDGLETIEYVKKLLKVLVRTDENINILTQWLAHQVQFPGRKIPWAPLIQSIHGIGKSAISNILSGVLGDDNVIEVGPEEAISKNNGWSMGHVVNILEELRIVGHSRYEVANKLKPLITDRTYTMSDKYIRAHKVLNTANYIIFTNFTDAVPIEDTDRRYWIVFAMLTCRADVNGIVGEHYKTFFSRLWDGIRNHPTEIRKWLLEDVEVTEEFKAIQEAPMTDEKQSMIALERANIPWLDDVSELIEAGNKYFNTHVVCAKDLWDAAEMTLDGFNLNPREKHTILSRLGYVTLGRIRVDGVQRQVWARGTLDKNQIIEKLGLK